MSGTTYTRVDDDSFMPVTSTTVPEPSTLALFGGSLAGFSSLPSVCVGFVCREVRASRVAKDFYAGRIGVHIPQRVSGLFFNLSPREPIP